MRVWRRCVRRRSSSVSTAKISTSFLSAARGNKPIVKELRFYKKQHVYSKQTTKYRMIYHDVSSLFRDHNLRSCPLHSPTSFGFIWAILLFPRHCLVPLRQLILEVAETCLCGSQFLGLCHGFSKEIGKLQMVFGTSWRNKWQWETSIKKKMAVRDKVRLFVVGIVIIQSMDR